MRQRRVSWFRGRPRRSRRPDSLEAHGDVHRSTGGPIGRRTRPAGPRGRPRRDGRSRFRRPRRRRRRGRHRDRAGRRDRGLSTGLLEQRDFGSGTSSRSSKAIPRQLRYLRCSTSASSARRCRSVTAAHPARRRTWCGRCRSSTRCRTGGGSVPTWGGSRALRRDGDGREARHGCAEAPAPAAAPGRPDRPGPAHRRADRRDPLPATPRSTTRAW